MEFFNSRCLPVCEQLGRLPRHLRLAGGTCGVIVAAGLWLLLSRGAPTEYEPLWEGHKLSAPQVARMTSAFKKHGLHKARISAEMIQVPAGAKDAYLVALDTEQAWPADFDAPLERAMSESNPLMPWQQNREQLARGEKQMLARIVEGLEGIETAAVQYDEIRQAGFPPKVEMRAMVAVRAEGGVDLDYEQIEAVRDTVAAFKGGLERRHVTVTDLNACRAYPGSTASDISHAAARAQAIAKRTLEDELRAKIEQRLAMYPGALIAVHAHFTEEPRKLPADLDAAEWAAPWRLARVSASIDLPKSYFRWVWQQRRGEATHQTPAAEELQQIEQEVCSTIQRAVAAMLPPQASGWSCESLVTVTSHDQLAESPVAAGGWPRTYWPWGLAAALPIAGAAWLVVALRQRRRTPRNHAPRAADQQPWTMAVVPAELPPPAPAAAGELGLPTLQEQLTTLVQRDPAAAAEVLKRWLKRAA